MSRRWLVVVMLSIVASCGGEASDGDVATTSAAVTIAPPAPTIAPASSAVPTPAASAAGGVTPQGFEAVAAEITAADGEVCAVCLWLAGDPEQRGRGLMGVTDMGGADGMVFVFEAPSTSAFWMLDTPMPLSIAFFDAEGVFVSAMDMAPCLDGLPAACPRYQAGGAYTSAIEVPAGELPELLIGPGSTLNVLDAPCDR